MDFSKDQWIVLRWPTDLLTSEERGCLEDYLDHNFSIDTVRFEAAPASSGVEILGAAQGVVRDAVLKFIEEFVTAPTTETPPVYSPDDD